MTTDKADRSFLTSLNRRARKAGHTLDDVGGFADVVQGDDETDRLVSLISKLEPVELRGGGQPAGPKPNSKAKTSDAARYDRHRDAMAERQRTITASGRDIGAIPEVVDPDRRAACRVDLKLYLETYHGASFPLPWSDVHLQLIRLVQAAIEYGGTQAMAMPRGWGKTTICTHAVKFAANYGFVPFVVIVGAEDGKAVRILNNIKTDYETNETLLEDFPEICYPIWKLERVVQRGRSQLCGGRPTFLEWSANWVALPTTTRADGSSPPGSGVVIAAAGIESAVRGLQFQHPATHAIVRPKLALVDDFQTDKSAKSLPGIEARENLISQAILGLAGPGESMGCLATCTVIKPRDAADRLLDRKTHPDWRGVRGQTLDSFPDDITTKRGPDDTSPRHWETWNKLRQTALRDETNDRPDFSRAAAYYQKHRKAMRAGAVIVWDKYVVPPWSDALETAMAQWFRDPAAFDSERQNAPREAVAEKGDAPTVEIILGKTTNRPRFEVPAWSAFLVAHVDVQKRFLAFQVEAGSPRMRSRVVDYGTGPKSHKPYWNRSSFEPTIADTMRTGNHRADVKRALLALVAELFSVGRYTRPDGSPVGMNLLLIDGGYLFDVVLEVCAETPHAGRVLPLRGRAPKPGSKRLGEYEERDGNVVGGIGKEWIEWAGKADGVRTLTADVNYWKSVNAGRWNTPEATDGGLSLFGPTASDHQLYADHQTAELPEDITRQGETRTVWEPIPNRDNEHLDNAVGCAVALSRCGAELPGVASKINTTKPTQPAPRKRRRVKV